MAIVSRCKSFQKNLLLSIGGIYVLFALCVITYQYHREKDYKIDIIHSRLQMYNYEMENALGKNLTNNKLFQDYVKNHRIQGLRVSIIKTDGYVLLDSYYAHVDSLKNHLHRTEIQQALHTGNGYVMKRLSKSTHENYFYSATRFGDLIIRTAVPYSAKLTHSLEVDYTNIYFSIFLTLLLGLVLYWITHRISRHIGYLREFAVKAEEGEELDHELERKLPDDELGDISHTIIQLYWKLRHSEDEKIRMKHQLTQNAAHELKTPAQSIHGYLESILDNPDMPADKLQHFLHRCYAQSERMNKLLADMNTLTKLDEMGNSMPGSRKEFQLVDVVPIIHNVLDDTILQLQEKGIAPVLRIPETIELIGDSSLIYGIFRNFVDNVLAYATGATQILISYQNGQFTFSDNGPGVSLEHIPHLFERFYRVDKGRSRTMGGTGLGLSIVKNAVVAHGGTIVAQCTPGGGLTYQFTLA